MTENAAQLIARAVLYEGYLLYPYTTQSTKNRQRWTFGGVYPKGFVAQNPGADRDEQVTECLIEGEGDPILSVSLRFLHLMARGGVDDWDEAQEREVRQERLSLRSISAGAATGASNGIVVRSHFHFAGTDSPLIQKPIEGALEISASQVGKGRGERDAYRIRVRVANLTEHVPGSRSEALLFSMISTHALLSVSGGRFVSLLDPPEELREDAAQCQNVGAWPVLVGDPERRDRMLSSPIILYDFPEIAPESPGDLFDGSEIDEVLSLRILTLSEAEKEEIRERGGRARELLERTEKLSPEELLRLHGRLRDLSGRGAPELRPGAKVRLNPGKRSDIFDIALRGMVATVESVEMDLEGNRHVAVTLEADPGQDLGKTGQPGHRFFFREDELVRI